MKTFFTVAAFLVLVALTDATTHFFRKHNNKYRCIRRCTDDQFLVCGNDGRTYWNECHLNNEKCKNNKLRKVYIGPCASIASSAGRGFQNKPVRGSDGNTYINVAFLDLASCLTKTYIQPVKTNTESCKKCDIGCRNTVNPVCGNDGITYFNNCVLEKTNCILGGGAIKKLHNGVCRAVLGRVVGAPKPRFVCGTDGKTYSNINYIRMARCENLNLKKRHDGPCKH